MGMTARGHEALEQAEAQLAKAKTVEQLRQAQAVIFPCHTACRSNRPPTYWEYRQAGRAGCAPALCAAKWPTRKCRANIAHGKT